MEIDVNRNGRLDVGDFVTLLGAPGPALDPTTVFTLALSDVSGAVGLTSSIPLRLTPTETAAAFLIEIRYDPDEVSLINIQAAEGLLSRRLGVGLPTPGRVVLLGYNDPPRFLRNAETVAYLLFRPRDGLAAPTPLTIEASSGDVVDLAGNLLPGVTLQSAALTLGTPSLRWELHR